MGQTPSTSFRLNKASVRWLERRVEETGQTKTQLIEALIEGAASDPVVVTGDDAKWLADEGRRRGVTAREVLCDALRSVRAAPQGYLAHVNAVQSWIAARLVTAMAYKAYGERLGPILDKAATDAGALFGPGPGQPPFDSATTPRSLRRVFTDIPELP